MKKVYVCVTMTSTPKSVEDALGGMSSSISAMNRLMRICVYVNVDSNTCYFRVYTIESCSLFSKLLCIHMKLCYPINPNSRMFHVI